MKLHEQKRIKCSKYNMYVNQCSLLKTINFHTISYRKYYRTIGDFIQLFIFEKNINVFN